jgi:energy-coupling factor transporter ATP-binding protein EcfA2
LESNPFRDLNFFDFEHAALYHGRTKAVGEVLDALKNQATAKKPFVLVLGPSGSGKSSLVRAGVLPLLTQGRTTLGNGPWRHALTRPGGRRGRRGSLRSTCRRAACQIRPARASGCSFARRMVESSVPTKKRSGRCRDPDNGSAESAHPARVGSSRCQACAQV